MATVGTIAGTGVIQDTVEVTSSRGSITKKYIVETADKATFLAQFSLGTSTDSGFTLAEIKERAAKGFSEFELRYVTAEELVQIEFGGTGTSKASDASTYEEPIEQHPDYSEGSSEVNGVPTLIGAGGTTTHPGVTGYLKPSTTYTYTQIVNSFTFSESNIVENVGSLNTPTGVSGATGTNWLKVGKSVSPVGDKYQITETWQYLPGGWKTSIYGTAV